MANRDNIKPVIAGLIIAIGLFRTWVAADILLGAYTIMYASFHKPNKWILAIALIPLLTIFWSEDYLAALLWTFRIIFLNNMLRDNLNRKSIVKNTVYIGLLIQVGVSLFVWLDHRPIAFSTNSEVMAAVGVAAIPTSILGVFAAGMTVGVSGARLAPALLFVSIFLSRFNKWVVATAIIGISMFVVQMLIQSPTRLTLNRLLMDWEKRESLIGLDDENTAKVVISIHRPDLLDKPIERTWIPWGYGYRSYVENTAASTPHNIWVLSWYDLGVLAIPFIGASLWLIRKWPIWAIAVSLIYITFVDMWYWMPSGIYAIALFSYTWGCSSNTKGETRPSASTMPLS